MFTLEKSLETIVYPIKEENVRKPLFFLGMKMLLVMFVTFIIGYPIFLVGMLMFQIPIIGWLFGLIAVIIGYAILFISTWFMNGIILEIERNRFKKDEFYLPVVNTKTFLRQTKDGLRVFLLQFVYMLPLIFVFGCIMSFFILATMSAGDDSVLEGIAGIAFVLVYLFVYLVMMVYMLLVLPVAEFLFVKSDKVRSSINFSKVWNLISTNWKEVLTYGLTVFIASMIFGMVVSFSYLLIFLCIGIIITPIVLGVGMAYLAAIQGNLRGQLYRHFEDSEEIQDADTQLE